MLPPSALGSSDVGLSDVVGSLTRGPNPTCQWPEPTSDDLVPLRAAHPTLRVGTGQSASWHPSQQLTFPIASADSARIRSAPATSSSTRLWIITGSAHSVLGPGIRGDVPR
jgi:hypothetical protein